jgi:hypothetical protein
MSSWRQLDAQMAGFSGRLIDAVKLPPDIAGKLATTVAAEVRFLSAEQKLAVKDSSPVLLSDRLSELQAFQGWMDRARHVQNDPYVTRAQILSQNYICFVYLSEACFRALAKNCPNDSATRKCAKFLTDNPVRAFRNAIAHANWKYRPDFKAIVFWARKGSEPNEPLEQFEVEQDVLNFWQALSRCIAYVSYSNL